MLKPLKLNMQYFADEAEDVPSENEGKPADSAKSDKPPEQPEQPQKTFTQEEVQKIIDERFAREREKAEKEKEEAKKLAEMNAQQKAEYERDKLKKEIEELRRKESCHTLGKEASKILAEQGIVATDDILAMVVRDDAESTQNAINDFVEVVRKEAEKQVDEALSGTPPKANINTKTISSGEKYAKQANKKAEPTKSKVWGD